MFIRRWKTVFYYFILVTAGFVVLTQLGDSFTTTAVRKKIYHWTTRWMYSDEDFDSMNDEEEEKHIFQPDREDNELLDTRDLGSIFKNDPNRNFEEELETEEGLEYDESDDLHFKDQYELPDIPTDQGGFVDTMEFPEHDHSHAASLFEGPEVHTADYLKQKDFPCDRQILTNRTGYKVYDLIKAYRHKDRKAVKARRDNRMDLWKQNTEIFKADPIKNGPIFADPDVPIKYPVNSIHVIPGKSLKLDMIEVLKFPEDEHLASKTKLVLKTYRLEKKYEKQEFLKKNRKT